MVLGPASADAARGRRAALVVVVGLGITAALGGYFLGRSGGEDLDAARSAGAAEGRHVATAGRTRAGYREGFAVGERAGYRQAFRREYRAAYKQAGGP